MATIQGEVEPKHKVAVGIPLTEVPAGPVYVTIPLRDIFDYRFPDIWINNDRYPAGQTYALAPAVAKVVQERVVLRQKHDLGLMSNRVNMEALRQLAGGDSLATAANGGNHVPVFDAGRLDAAGIHI